MTAAAALPIRIGATNVTGLGAVQLAQSLLPAFDRLGDVAVEALYLPDRGALAEWSPAASATRTTIYRRRVPQSLSRVLECMIPQHVYAGTTPLLTLGDLPIRTAARQVVLVQTPHLTKHGSSAAKYRIARALFRANLCFAAAIVVQTEAMRAAMCATYALDPARLHVIAQPPPDWLTATRLQRNGRIGTTPTLSLFYPAADYPHKNHRLLAAIRPHDWDRLDARLTLTIDPSNSPNPALRGVDCVGRLSPDGVIAAYAQADALLFLSLSESYGFPLVEAMWARLPIVCPDLPYARTLCGDEALYFAPHDPASLLAAIAELQTRLAAGWWPDWRAARHRLPPSWDAVARQMLGLLHPNARI